MNIKQIKSEFVDKMDKQENFFSSMQEMEQKHGTQFILDFLKTSPTIKKQYTDIVDKNKNAFKDYFNVLFHHSLDRIITQQEHIDMIMKAFENYKKKGSWRTQKAVIKRLVKASNPDTGKCKRKRFEYLK